MAKGFAIHNAPTDHGGRIPSTQMRSSQQGNLFVRAGDGHFCPKCKGWSTVVKSHDHVIFDGKAVAYVGDKLTCGARIQPQQSHVVGESGSYYGSSSSTFTPVSSQQNSTNSVVAENRYENYYVERNQQDYVKFRNALLPYDSDKFGKRGGGVLIQSLSGSCEFIVNSVVRGTELFVSVSYMPPVLKEEAKIFAWASLKLYQQHNRELKFIESHQLKKDSGYWDTSRGKEPVGSCTIKLPKPNLDVIKVVLEMGYEAKFDGGRIIPMPNSVTHTFTLTSGARRVQ